MLAGEDVVTGLNNESVPIVVQSLARVVCVGGGFLKGGVGRDHLSRHQIVPDAEMFERALRLRAPEHGAGDFHFAKAVALRAKASLLRACDCTHLVFHSALSISPPTQRTWPWLSAAPRAALA